MNRAKTRLAVLGAVVAMLIGLVVVVLGPAQAKNPPPTVAIPWSAAEGRPNVTPGSAFGYYVWHEGNVVHIMTTSPNDKPELFDAHIRVIGGTISSAVAVDPKHLDTVRLSVPDRLYVRLHPKEGQDSVRFAISGGSQLSIIPRIKTHHTLAAFYGPHATPIPENPVVFDLTK